MGYQWRTNNISEEGACETNIGEYRIAPKLNRGAFIKHRHEKESCSISVAKCFRKILFFLAILCLRLIMEQKQKRVPSPPPTPISQVPFLDPIIYIKVVFLLLYTC